MTTGGLKILESRRIADLLLRDLDDAAWRKPSNEDGTAERPVREVRRWQMNWSIAGSIMWIVYWVLVIILLLNGCSAVAEEFGLWVIVLGVFIVIGVVCIYRNIKTLTYELRDERYFEHIHSRHAHEGTELPDELNAGFDTDDDVDLDYGDELDDENDFDDEDDFDRNDLDDEIDLDSGEKSV
jgi:hypothetical protein